VSITLRVSKHVCPNQLDPAIVAFIPSFFVCGRLGIFSFNLFGETAVLYAMLCDAMLC
jgi:hypothetical protein